MSIPTVAVTCTAFDQNGNPVAGGLFRARLDRTETYNGFVVSEQVTGVADANGVCVLQLWPNALGVAGSAYRITAINPDTKQQYLNTTAVVPNSACNLHEIIVAAPYPAIDASEQALIAAQGALALVTAQAGIATAAATDAEGFADDSQASALAAQASAGDANASFTDFDKRYLGTKSSDPLVDNEGNALQIGALYYLLERGLRIYDGASWSAAYISESGTLTSSDIGVTVQAYNANLDDFAAKTAPAGEVVGTTDAQTLSAKSISGTTNTLSNIANASLVNSTVIVNGQAVALGGSTTVTAVNPNALTIGTGLNGSSYNGSAPVTVSLANTAVNPAAYGSASKTLTATVNAQGQLTAMADTPIAIANTQVSGLGTASTLNAGVALGVATLDAAGTVPLSQIPSSIQGGVSYQGSWNASTNTPTIASGVGSKGHYYVVSVAGSTNIDGITDWLPGDWIIFNGTAWEQIDNTDSVTSVNGYVGAVSLVASDVGLGNVDNTSDATKNSATATLTNKTIDLTNNTLVATSAQLAAAVTDETGSGALVFATSPTLVTPALGTPSALVGTNITGTAAGLNIGGNAATATTSTNVSGGTASVTTLTTSGAVTHNGGTANGVAYLNGSKVLTSGSALTFDGSALGVAGRASLTGGGLTGSGNGMHLYFDTGSNTGFIKGFHAGVDDRAIRIDGLNLQFAVAGSEQMRLTSTGLGIGTSSPAYKLVVSNGGASGIEFGPAFSGTANLIQSYNRSGSAYVNTVYDANEHIFYTLGTERLRIDSSGNLTLNSATANGVGYFNGSKVLTSGSALTFDGTNLALGTPALAARVMSVRGRAAFIAPSNDSQLAIYSDGVTNGLYSTYNSTGSYLPMTFFINDAEQMRLTSTGLGIGTSSPSTKLTVHAGADGDVGFFRGGSTRQVQIGTSSTAGYINTDNGSAGLEIRTQGTARVYLDNFGNLGLGVTPSAWGVGKAFEVGSFGNALWGVSSNDVRIMQNAYYSDAERYASSTTASMYRQSSGIHQWFTAPSGTAGNAISFTQAMSLLASGDLAIGRTSTIGGARISAETVTGTPTYAAYLSTTGTETAFLLVNPNGAVGSITTNGSATTYNTSSDYRLKNITGPITTSGAYIDSLNPVEGTWKADGSTFVGLIAHEVQEASRTQVATGVKDGEEMQGMDYSSAEIIANLIAEVKSLRQRLAAAGI